MRETIPTWTLSECDLCPRQCGVDRLSGRRGFCSAGVPVEIYRYGPHHGEEPPISGTGGSGTVFFSRCTMRCIYCQNHPWSSEGAGAPYHVTELADIFRELQAGGCINWNLVSPTPWLPQISEALTLVDRDGIRLPVVYNTSGFERVETIERAAGFVDIFLTDLRYSRESSAREGSLTDHYVKTARRALLKMWEIAGELHVRDDIATRGTICRLLILPGRDVEAVENLQWLADNVGTDIAISIMAQYLPAYKAAAVAGWNRSINRKEYDRVCGEAERLGFDRGWIQEFTEETSPEFIGHCMKPVHREGYRQEQDVDMEETIQ